ncbi:MAG: hypothetical protein M1820_002528 [Bogoriella megaspora]|nr:MAG: hypothetical protein M1820_002528 [Bogoriella megaspora]
MASQGTANFLELIATYDSNTYIVVETQLRKLFKRCVQCPNATPSCPVCPSGQICSQTTQSCTQCAAASCVPSTDAAADPPPSSSNNGPNVGAIAGGVIGGVVFIALLTFLVWRFIIKPRRDQYEQEEWQEEEYAQEPKATDGNNDFAMQRDARASTHTVGSIASTVLTRASNVIQIAYIPGVTNRGGPESPDVLVPPVPPIPAMGSPANSPYASQRSDDDSHYFMPSDLRGSTYSADSDARSFQQPQRQSITPSLARTSMASTMYRDNAIVSPVPAQSAVRGKAAVVSVKSGSSSGENTPAFLQTPPVPSIDLAKIGKPLQVKIPASADRPGPSPLGSVSSKGSATFAKPIALNITKMKSKQKSGSSTPAEVSSISDVSTIKAGSPKQAGSLSSPKDAASSSSRPHSRAQQSQANPSTFDDTTDDDDEDEHARSRRSLIGRTNLSTEISSDAPTLNSNNSPDSPFADQSSSLLASVDENDERRHSQRLGINAVIEEATRRASRQPTHNLGSDKRNQSPFDDSHATDDN